MKNKTGRPKMKEGTANNVLFAVRVSQQDADKIEDQIKKSGLTKPEWIRKKLLD